MPGLVSSSRYMLILYPIGALLSLLVLRTYWRSDRSRLVKSAVSILIAAMVIVAIQYQVRGVAMLYRERERLTTWESALQGRGPVVTDVWWLASAIAPFFTAHEMYCVRKRDEVAGWAVTAAEHGIDRFTFASLKDIDGKELGSATVTLLPEAQKVVAGLHVATFRLAGDDMHSSPSAGGSAR